MANYLIGKNVFNKVIRANEDAYFLIFPDDNSALSEAIIRLDRYLKSEYQRVVIIGRPGIKDRIKMEVERIEITDKQMDGLMDYLTLKVDVLGRSIYSNVKVISFYYFDGEINKKLLETGIFDIDYIVKNRILNYHNE